jgi:chemotaxis protein methyltransferase CheR
LIDALTTNETYFFRDQQVFAGLSNHLVRHQEQEAKAAGTRPRLRIWSAACSTGQEIYSTLFTLAGVIEKLNAWDLTLVATDVSPAAVAQAKSGSYSDHEIARGLPIAMRDRFMKRDGARWQVLPEWRNRITFAEHNLIREPAFNTRFDVILCRNVTIYFDAATRKAVFDRLTRLLAPEGYLFVGGSETLFDLGDAYRPHRLAGAVCYRPQLQSPASNAVVAKSTTTTAPVKPPIPNTTSVQPAFTVTSTVKTTAPIPTSTKSTIPIAAGQSTTRPIPQSPASIRR